MREMDTEAEQRMNTEGKQAVCELLSTCLPSLCNYYGLYGAVQV
jgi:hypothetical protein